MKAPQEDRDLAGEATEMEAYRRRLRADISPEEAELDLAARDAEQELRDDEDYMGDPDEYDEPWCICSVEHSIEELDSNRCDCCGRPVA